VALQHLPRGGQEALALSIAALRGNTIAFSLEVGLRSSLSASPANEFRMVCTKMDDLVGPRCQAAFADLSSKEAAETRREHVVQSWWKVGPSLSTNPAAETCVHSKPLILLPSAMTVSQASE
jgi:hypothetical protein